MVDSFVRGGREGVGEESRYSLFGMGERKEVYVPSRRSSELEVPTVAHDDKMELSMTC
jgi:hypothetical protein